jgi:hypothetical protein
MVSLTWEIDLLIHFHSSFIFCLAYRSLTRSPKWPVIVGYIFFLLITLIPVLWMWTLPPSSNGDFYHNRNGPVIFYVWLHMWYVNYVVTIIGFSAALPQVHELRNRSDSGALSVSGLGGQAFVFAIIAISWLLRLKWGAGVLHTVRSWYEWVGWAPLDNAAFAITQMVVMWAASRCEKPRGSSEITPLLS